MLTLKRLARLVDGEIKGAADNAPLRAKLVELRMRLGEAVLDRSVGRPAVEAREAAKTPEWYRGVIAEYDRKWRQHVPSTDVVAPSERDPPTTDNDDYGNSNAA